MTVTEKISDAGLQQSEAFPLEIGKTMYGTLDTSFNEWFVCSFTQSGTYTLNLANKNVDTTIYATVYDALGTELGTISAGKNRDSKNSLEIAAGTALYIKITRYDSRCFGNYTLLVN